MYVLGIDTALYNCSVAISKNGEEVYNSTKHCPNSQAEEIAPMVSLALSQTGIDAKNLSKIIVTAGPGSFTGVRVGLAFATSLALAVDIPCIGVSTLETFAVQSAAYKSIPIINIAGSVFHAAFDGRKELVAPCRANDFSFLNTFEDGFVLVGPAANQAQELFPQFDAVKHEAINPFILAAYGASLPQTQKATPLYLRGADAKLWKGALGEVG
jgi:tRNA threonylcarbamoyl adenosine modification protein YeaZ